MKRVISIIISAAILVSVLSMYVFAKSVDVVGVNYIYTTGMQVVLENADCLRECTLLENGEITLDNETEFEIADNLATLSFKNRLQMDRIYSVVFTSSDGSELTKSFRFNKVYSEDFQGDEWDVGDDEMKSGTPDSPKAVGNGLKYISSTEGKGKYRIMQENGNRFFLASGGISSEAGLYINNTLDNEYTTVEFDLGLKHPFNYNYSSKYGQDDIAQPPIGVQFRAQLENLSSDRKYIGSSSLWSYVDKTGSRKYFFNTGAGTMSLQRGALGYNITSDGTMTIERYKEASKGDTYANIQNDFNMYFGKQDSNFSAVDEISAENWSEGEYHFASSYVDSLMAMRVDSPKSNEYSLVLKTNDDDYIEESGYAAINLCGRYVPSAGKYGTSVDNILVYKLEDIDLDQVMNNYADEFELTVGEIAKKITLIDEKKIINAQNILDKIPEKFYNFIDSNALTKFKAAKKDISNIKYDAEESGIKLYLESTLVINKGKFVYFDEQVDFVQVNFQSVDDWQYFWASKLIYIPGKYFEQKEDALIIVNGYQLLISVGDEDTDKGTMVNCDDKNITIKESYIDGITYGTYGDFIKQLTVPFDCKVICDSENDIIPMNGSGVIRVEKIFDKSIYTVYNLHVNNYFNVKYEDEKPLFDYDKTSIYNVPFGLSVEAFFDSIISSDMISMKLFDGVTEKTEGTVNDEDLLKLYIDGAELAVYQITVIPASTDNSFAYKGQLNLSEITDVKYLSSFNDFLANITGICEFATVAYPYNSNDLIKNDFSFDIIAQNGDKKTVKVKIDVDEAQKSTSLSSLVYEIKDNVIENITTGITIDEMKSNLICNGTISVYNSKMQEIKNGVLVGGETVRVYALYDMVEYEVYTIAFNDCTDDYKAEIINVNSSQCEMSEGYKAYGDGYEANTSNNCTMTFTSTPFDSEKEIIIKANTKHDYSATYTRTFNATIYKNEKYVEELKNLGGQKTEDYVWNDITKIKAAAGDVIKVVLQTNMYTIFRDIAFFDKGDAEIISIASKDSQSLRNFATDDSIVITFKKEMNVKTLNKQNISLISQNGYEVEYDGLYDDAKKTYTITPRYSLAKNTEYYIYINKKCMTMYGYNIARIYVELIKTQGVRIKAKLLYKDENSKYIAKSNGAKSVYVLADNVDYADKIYVAIYSYGVMKEFSLVTPNTEHVFSKTLGKGDAVKLMVFDSNEKFCYLAS